MLSVKLIVRSRLQFGRRFGTSLRCCKLPDCRHCIRCGVSDATNKTSERIWRGGGRVRMAVNVCNGCHRVRQIIITFRLEARRIARKKRDHDAFLEAAQRNALESIGIPAHLVVATTYQMSTKTSFQPLPETAPFKPDGAPRIIQMDLERLNELLSSHYVMSA